MSTSKELVKNYVKHYEEAPLHINILGQRVLFNGQPCMLLKEFEKILLELGYFHDVDENTVVTGFFKKQEIAVLAHKETIQC